MCAKAGVVNNLMDLIWQFDSSLKISRINFRRESEGGFDYLDDLYFIELDKINLTSTGN